jgi:hypothetical protein
LHSARSPIRPRTMPGSQAPALRPTASEVWSRAASRP